MTNCQVVRQAPAPARAGGTAGNNLFSLKYFVTTSAAPVPRGRCQESRQGYTARYPGQPCAPRRPLHDPDNVQNWERRHIVGRPPDRCAPAQPHPLARGPCQAPTNDRSGATARRPLPCCPHCRIGCLRPFRRRPCRRKPAPAYRPTLPTRMIAACTCCTDVDARQFPSPALTNPDGTTMIWDLPVTKRSHNDIPSTSGGGSSQSAPDSPSLKN